MQRQRPGRPQERLTRRGFARAMATTLASAVLSPRLGSWPPNGVPALPTSPDSERLGRVVQDGVELKLRPDPDSQTLAVLAEDAVVHWLREVVGPPPRFQLNWRWVETPEGYLFAPQVQPVRELVNSPLQALPQTDMGPGMWAEVSVPYVDLTLHDGQIGRAHV